MTETGLRATDMGAWSCRGAAEAPVPEISRFFGIRIFMNWGDHGPPHFHAKYGEHAAQVAIETASILEGRLPPRVAALVREWATGHKAELRSDWILAQAFQPLRPIAPLE